MNHTLNGDVLTLCFEGRVDTTNAGQVEADAMAIVAENAGKTVEIDASKLEYISSAGLRVVMKLRKKCPELSISNVNQNVYEILEMTGFSEMIPVTKALRTISLDGCKEIGRGATGAVYRLDEERLAKVFNKGSSVDIIKMEKQRAQTAFLAGVPTAISFETVMTDQGYGIIYELLNAKDLSKVMLDDMEHMDDYIKQYARFLKSCHQVELDPKKALNIKVLAAANVDRLPAELCTEEEKVMLKSVFENIPERHTFIHGDAHVGNVMLQDGELVFIDMTTCGMAHPIFDLMSMYIFFYMNANNPQRRLSNEFASALTPEQCVRVWKTFLAAYLETDDEQLMRKAEEQIMVFTCTRSLLACVVFPGVIPMETLKQLKMVPIGAVKKGLEPLCF